MHERWLRGKKPDKDIVFAALRYDAATGDFFWKRQPSYPAVWNLRWADKKAGYVDRHYVYICIKGQSLPAHAVAFLFVTGAWPSVIVDHIDGNGHNNRADNLRSATASQNCINRRLQTRNTSGHTGIKLIPKTGRWRVKLCRRHIGVFSTLGEAVAARREAELRQFGAFSPHYIDDRANEGSVRGAR